MVWGVAGSCQSTLRWGKSERWRKGGAGILGALGDAAGVLATIMSISASAGAGPDGGDIGAAAAAMPGLFKCQPPIATIVVTSSVSIRLDASRNVIDVSPSIAMNGEASRPPVNCPRIIISRWLASLRACCIILPLFATVGDRLAGRLLLRRAKADATEWNQGATSGSARRRRPRIGYGRFGLRGFSLPGRHGSPRNPRGFGGSCRSAEWGFGAIGTSRWCGKLRQITRSGRCD